MKTEVICCAKGCGKHLNWIDTPCGGTSHGYCEKHFEEAMREADNAFWRDRDEALRQQEEDTSGDYSMPTGQVVSPQFARASQGETEP